MKTQSLLLEPAKYRSPLGPVAPPGNVPDSSRFGNNGVFNGAVAWTRLPSGLYVLNFVPAGTDHVTFAGLRLDVDRTFEFIAIPDFIYNGVGSFMLFSWRIDANNYIYIEHPGDATITMGYNAGGAGPNLAGATVVFTAGSPLIIHCVVDKTGVGEIRYYVNGVSQASDAAPALGTMSASTSTLYLGSNTTPANYYKGKILPLNIFNYALPAGVVNDRFAMLRSLVGI